jgi:hypothetical protein
MGVLLGTGRCDIAITPTLSKRFTVERNLSYHHLARAHIKSSMCILMELSSFKEVLFPKE